VRLSRLAYSSCEASRPSRRFVGPFPHHADPGQQRRPSRQSLLDKHKPRFNLFHLSKPYSLPGSMIVQPSQETPRLEKVLCTNCSWALLQLSHNLSRYPECRGFGVGCDIASPSEDTRSLLSTRHISPPLSLSPSLVYARNRSDCEDHSSYPGVFEIKQHDAEAHTPR
jgi:hypothetical protein